GDSLDALDALALARQNEKVVLHENHARSAFTIEHRDFVGHGLGIAQAIAAPLFGSVGRDAAIVAFANAPASGDQKIDDDSPHEIGLRAATGPRELVEPFHRRAPGASYDLGALSPYQA